MKNYPEIELIHSFIKNLNLEVLDPLELLTKKNDLIIDISPLGIKSRKIGNEKFEVVSDCKIIVTNSEEDKIFNLEIEFSGIFKIQADSYDLKQLVYVDCASSLYPFIRTEIINITAKAGMSPVILPYINFKSQYKKMQRDQQNEQY